MKLKKILALALSGVLAISMLAGCAGGNGSKDGLKKDGILKNATLNTHGGLKIMVSQCVLLTRSAVK